MKTHLVSPIRTVAQRTNETKYGSSSFFTLLHCYTLYILSYKAGICVPFIPPSLSSVFVSSPLQGKTKTVTNKQSFQNSFTVKKDFQDKLSALI